MKRKHTALFILGLISMLTLSACGTLQNAAKLTEYAFGDDLVPTVNAVIGAQRKVTGVASGFSNGTQYKEYSYESETMQEDLSTYLNHLMESGWTPISDFDLNDGMGEARVAIESVEAGKVMIVTVTFEPGKYVIEVEKAVGTLTRN